MVAPSVPVLETVTIALLADRSDRGPGDRIHAVAAWTDRGERCFARLTTPVGAGRSVAGLPEVSRPRPVQLTLDLGVAEHPWCSSSGRTWATWTLTSIPPVVRTLPLDAAVTALARQLGAAA